MNSILPFAFTILVQFMVNIVDSQKTAAQFLEETFEYIHHETTCGKNLKEAKNDFQSKNRDDFKDARLMAEADTICSEPRILLVSQQNQRPAEEYQTRTVVACIFLTYIKPRGPFFNQGEAEDLVFFGTGDKIYERTESHPEKAMRLMLQEDIRTIITQEIENEQVRLHFFEYCTAVINTRWGHRIDAVMPCALVTKYWLIIFPRGID